MLKRQQLHEQCQLHDLSQVIDHLSRHCFAPDDSLVSKSTYHDLQLAKEEMCRERLQYLEAMAIYSEAIAMVEDYDQGWGNPPQLYETLEHLMITAEAAQKLRLPLLSKDGDVHDEEIESILSQSSPNSPGTSFTIGSSSNSPNSSGASTFSATNNYISPRPTPVEEPALGGLPNYFLGIAPASLRKTQFLQIPVDVDMSEYQLCLSDEIEARLRAKCDKLAGAFEMEDIDWSSSGWNKSSDQLLERVKLITDELEGEEAALKEDLYLADRKFTEYYNVKQVLEQILGVLIKLVRNLKLQHQHKYDELQKIFLGKRCETIDAKLRSLENGLLYDTYSKDSVPALHKIRKYLVEATKEASITHDKAVTRLLEYQSVDADFNKIARQYYDIVQKLENMQWTIEQVEMDLKRSQGSP